MSGEKQAFYTHGHHPAVLRSHTWRTAANSVGYLLPHLRPDMTILDIGCGPGTITADLAKLVPQGKVIGMDAAAGVLEQAKATAVERGVKNVEFVTGNIHSLDYPDESFDVVHVHQVLQHINDQVGALREMGRVCKKGGLVAARESDFPTFSWWPQLPGMNHWMDVYLRVTKGNGGEPDAGRKLHVWAKQAGFERKDITSSAGTWCYATADEIEWWSELWAERTVDSAFAESALAKKTATREDLQKASEAWKEWGSQEDAWFVCLHGEILCRKT
jgi:ubiquinone/menaquinone biosynthesis C-methylase UbiE